MNYAAKNVSVYYIDPKPATIYDLQNPIEIIEKSATEGMQIVKEGLLNLK